MPTALRIEKGFEAVRIYERPGDRLKESLPRQLRRHTEFWALRVSTSRSNRDSVGIRRSNGCGKVDAVADHLRTLAPTQATFGITDASRRCWNWRGFRSRVHRRRTFFDERESARATRRETETLFPAIERFAEIVRFFISPSKRIRAACTYASRLHCGERRA